MFKPKAQTNLNVESVIVPSRNGLNFGASQQIHFDIPRNIGFANLKNARIVTSILVDTVPNSTAPPLIPDRIAGAHCFIERVNIRSNGVLLEQLDNYNVYAKLYNSASWDSGIENKRTRIEGCMKSNRIQDSPYHVTAQAVTTNTASTSVIRSVPRQVEIPLLGGIFQYDSIWPIGSIPLEVEIILARAEEVLSLPDSAGGTDTTERAPLAIRANPSTTTFTQGIRCVTTAGGPDTFVDLTTAQAACYGPNGGGNQSSLDVNQNPISTCPLKPGMQVRFTADAANANLTAAAVAGTLTITNIIVQANGVLRVNLNAAVDAGAAANPILSVLNVNGGNLNSVAPTYQWQNPRLLIPKVVPPPQFASAMMEAIMKNKFSIDVNSYVNYRNAIVGTTTTSTSIIPADLSRVKAILSVPIDQNNLDRLDRRNALCPNHMYAQNYQYQINNNLQPSRLVQVGRESFGVPADWFSGAWEVTKAIPYDYGLGNCLGAVHGYELHKALEAADIPVHNLKFITQPENQNGCYAIGRILGPYGTSANLMGISSIIYINYDGGNNNLKLLNNYVSHIRSFVLGPSGAQVIY